MGLFGRRAATTVARGGSISTKRAVTAAAREIEISPEKRQEAYFKKREDWQCRVWEIHDELAIVREAARFHGDAFARIRQFAGVQPDPQAEPIALEEAGDATLGEFSYTAAEAQAVSDALERLSNPLGGRAQIMRAAGIQMFMPGEFWLVGRPDPTDLAPLQQRWDVYSVDELIIDTNQKRTNSEGKEVPTYRLKIGGSTTATITLHADTYVWRIWRPHPRYSEWADSPMKAALPICERLLLLEKSINSGLMSRAKGPGVWIWPRSALRGPTGNEPTQDGQAANLPVVNDLITGLGTALNDPASAYAQVPIVIGVDDDVWKDQDWKNKLITWDRELDRVAADQRTEARTEFAIGIDLPPEQLLGLGDINHWGAWKVSEETFQSNIEPSVMIVNAGFTVGFLWPILRIEGIERPERFVIWHDAGELVSDPEKKINAFKAHADYLISNEATRREVGYSEDDAPTPEEIAARVAIDAARSGRVAPPIAPESAPDTGPPGVTASAMTGLENLPALLGTMDSNLLRDVQAEADAAMRRALERANARLRSLAQRDRVAKAAIETVPAESLLVAQTLGPHLVAQITGADEDGNGGEDLFGGAFLALGAWYDRRVGRVTAQTIRLARQRGSLSIAEADQLEAELAEERGASWSVLLAGLTATAAALLGRPEPPRGPEADGRFVPIGLPRTALSRAGGGGEKAVSLLTGDTITKLWSQAGIAFDGWIWQYGDPSTRHQPFEPHEALDGVEFDDPDSDDLGATTDWPGVSHYWPGDHELCQCSVMRTGAHFAEENDSALAELGGLT